MTIKDKTLKIEIKNKINEIKKEDLLEIFCIINSFKILETKKGNEYEKAWIKIKYIKNTIITEYINIFKLIRTPMLYEFINYFSSIKENLNPQNTETKLNITDYLEEIENISQDIIIYMVFNIETKPEEIEIEKNKLKKIIQATAADKYTFELIENKKE